MYLIVGCGLTGAVLAERITNVLKTDVLIIEKRNHIGGNCYDYIDEETGIRINKYGAHLFHTKNKDVWDYVNRFDQWKRWEHTVLSKVDTHFVSVPVNITTVNVLCDQHLQSSEEMDTWLSEVQVSYDRITNSEQMAKSRVGSVLYEKMFKPYTMKQWNKDPSELDPSVMARIPVRNSFDTRYFSDPYQALPANGYTRFFERLLNHPRIQYKLNTDFFQFRKQHDMTQFEGIIFTGPIDQYFQDKQTTCSVGSKLESLEYRSIDFNIKRFKNTGYFQPNSVVNYPSLTVPFTRIVEYKHFLHQESPHTIIVSETTNDHGDPYYPVPNQKNLALYNKYKALASEEEANSKVYFVGRLANYKYFNMDEAVANALQYFEERIQPSFG